MDAVVSAAFLMLTKNYYREHNAIKKAWKDRYESISVESKTSDIEHRAGRGALLTCFDMLVVSRVGSAEMGEIQHAQYYQCTTFPEH